jgi:hypothetical protein
MYNASIIATTEQWPCVIDLCMKTTPDPDSLFSGDVGSWIRVCLDENATTVFIIMFKIHDENTTNIAHISADSGDDPPKT